MLDGLLDLSGAGIALAALLFTHVTIVSVTVFLHRHQAHRALTLHPLASHFFRLWLWLTTGMVTREWVAVHRRHHAHCETAEDPHSPQCFGVWRVLREGTELYRAAARDRTTVERYGRGTPDDWLEHHVYSAHPLLGITLMLVVDLLLFGALGLTVWAVQMIWIPVWAAGVINGLGHALGYRNFASADASTNIVPWGLLIGGEELHNNHHAYPGSARLSARWWEIDLGWYYIRLLETLQLARVKRVAPRLTRLGSPGIHGATGSRLRVLATYARVISRVHRDELRRTADLQLRRHLKRMRRLLLREETLLDGNAREELERVLAGLPRLSTVYQFRSRLRAVWNEASAGPDQVRVRLAHWCEQAEASGIGTLEEFARRLRCCDRAAT